MSVRFGPALVHFQPGRPLRHLSESVFVPVNGQGVMAAGLAGEVRVAAGPEVEQELRRQGPLLVGSAYLTGAGKLHASGVLHLVHGIVVAQPGGSPRRDTPLRALEAGLDLLQGTSVRSLTLPLINHQAPERSEREHATGLASILAAHLRRGSLLREVTVAGLDSAYLQGARAALIDLGGRAE